MTTQTYPIAARYPAEVEWLTGVDPPPLALLAPEAKQQLLADMQALIRIQCEFLAAQQVISLIDLYALRLAYQTAAMADLLKTMYGSSAELEEFERAWRHQNVQGIQELLVQAHTYVLTYLKGA
jgi:hypothetical protein